MSDVVVYGIKSCDTCRKALKWLEGEGVSARFHDFRAEGLDAASLERWLAAVGWERLLNQRSTTWRQLPAAVRATPGPGTAKSLMLEHPTLIKRPVFEVDGRVEVGFGKAEQAALKAALD